jgi:hypothetical protein
MPIRHHHEHHHHHHSIEAREEVLRRLDSLLDINGLILDRSDTIMALIDDLKQKMDAATASIQRNSDLDDSIITMLTAESQQIKDLKAALEAAGTDPQKLQELADAMDALITKSDAEATKKADAVTANTPAA